MPGQPPQPSDAAASETLPGAQRILQVYDALHQARETGRAYHSPLVPPPAVRHLGQERPQHMQRHTTSRVHQVDPRPADKYKTCVPLLDLHAVAGAFVEGEEVEPEMWFSVPPGRVLRPGMFVAQMVGHAMEPQILMGPTVCSNASVTNGHMPCKGALYWPSTAISTILRLAGTMPSGAMLRNSTLG